MKLLNGASHLFSNLPLYLWIVFVYHEVHEDHEEFIIKLYRPLRFKPRGLPRGILVTWFHFVPFVLFVVIFLYLAPFAPWSKALGVMLGLR